MLWIWCILVFHCFLAAYRLPNVGLISPERSIWKLASVTQQDSSPIVENGQMTLLKFIEQGRKWAEIENVASVDINDNYNGYRRVTGCISTVKLKVTYTHATGYVKVHGIADSYVTLGMLAVIAKKIETLSAQEVLALMPDEYSKSMNLSQIFPVGRINGFNSIVKVIQQLLRRKMNAALKNQDAESESDSLKETDQIDPTNSEASPTISPEITPVSYDSIPTLSADTVTQVDPRSEEIAMLISGGVDSAVAMKLLLQQGHKVRAYYLKIWLSDEIQHLNECPWEEDISYVQKTCDQLQVPLEIISFQKEYHEHVVQYLIKNIKLGLTPNPDIMCNHLIKFGVFYEKIGKYHKKIASGHYAKLVPNPFNHSSSEKTHLLQYVPENLKDQTYFLCQIPPKELHHLVFPIGDMTKPAVRALAEQYNLPSKDRKDSTGICFLGKLNYDEFISHYLGSSFGPIYDYDDFVNNPVTSPTPIGEHIGLWYHTIGQRKGVGELLGDAVRSKGPWFVIFKDMKQNALFVTNQWEKHSLSRKRFTVEGMHWFIDDLMQLPYERAPKVTPKPAASTRAPKSAPKSTPKRAPKHPIVSSPVAMPTSAPTNYPSNRKEDKDDHNNKNLGNEGRSAIDDEMHSVEDLFKIDYSSPSTTTTSISEDSYDDDEEEEEEPEFPPKSKPRKTARKDQDRTTTRQGTSERSRRSDPSAALSPSSRSTQPGRSYDDRASSTSNKKSKYYPRKDFEIPPEFILHESPEGWKDGEVRVKVDVKLRHGREAIAVPCWLYWTPSPTNGGGEEGNTEEQLQQQPQVPNKVRIELIEKDKGLAPGQFAVFYYQNYCIASGIISDIY